MIITCEKVVVKVILIKRILIITNKLIDKLIITTRVVSVPLFLPPWQFDPAGPPGNPGTNNSSFLSSSASTLQASYVQATTPSHGKLKGLNVPIGHSKLLAQGQATLPKQMIFWKRSNRALTPTTSFSENHDAIFRKTSEKALLKGPKSET